MSLQFPQNQNPYAPLRIAANLVAQTAYVQSIIAGGNVQDPLIRSSATGIAAKRRAVIDRQIQEVVNYVAPTI
jgi:hypothetical protein